jgi:RNA-directed DNA polymerase
MSRYVIQNKVAIGRQNPLDRPTRCDRRSRDAHKTPGVWLTLDDWMRHRSRAIQLKHWRHGPTIYRELRALGASAETARQVAANNRCWWRNSDRALKRVLTIAYFDQLGVPRLL